MNVLLRLGAVERFQVAAGDHPLVERIELRTGKTLLQHPVAGQHQPHPRLVLLGQVGQRADFVQQPQRQRVGLIDQEHHALRALVARASRTRPAPAAIRPRPCRDRAAPIRKGWPGARRGACPIARCSSRATWNVPPSCSASRRQSSVLPVPDGPDHQPHAFGPLEASRQGRSGGFDAGGRIILIHPRHGAEGPLVQVEIGFVHGSLP